MTIAPTAGSSQLRGIAFACFGAVILSFSAVMIRQIEYATSWQIIFYRSIGLFWGLLSLFALRNRGHVLRSLTNGFSRVIAAGPFQGMASIFFILALTHTTIANALLTLSATPLLTSVVGWLIIRERVPGTTLMAMAGAAAGIGIMTFESIRIGSGIGSLFAIASALAFSIYIVMLRRGSRNSDIDMLPAVIVGAMCAIFISIFIIKPFAIGWHDLFICLAWGAIVQTSGLALVTMSVRVVPAAELALIVLLESVLAPIWAWRLFNEIPRLVTIVGGSLTVVTIGIWIALRIPQERKRLASRLKQKGEL